MFTHFPKDPNCAICQGCKVARSYCRAKQGKPDETPEPLHFGDAITADHTFLADEEASRKGHTVALVVQDRATHWLQGYTSETKSAEDTVDGFNNFMPIGRNPEQVYTDNSEELKKACKIKRWYHDTSIPYRPETNGVIERANRRLKEGVSCLLQQSGLSTLWWPEAMKCYCFLHNLLDKQNNGKTPWQQRLEDDNNKTLPIPLTPFTGHKYCFGQRIHYKATSPDELKRVQKFGDKTLPGIFLHYTTHKGGCWKKGYKIIDEEDILNAN